MTPNKDGFRSDIVRLRALAVILVLFSHFDIPGFNFGFIGVDVFFVISGFLITRILYKDYLSSIQSADGKGSLALGTFFLRRVRRLLPAALTVIIGVNLASYFLYNAGSRSDLLVDSKWALFFLANVSFLRSESDYFQLTNEPSMLQHYWSLSVEEQFYFVWPILFLIAASFQKLKIRGKYFRFNGRILTLIGVVSIASFVFLQFGFKVAPLQAYFSIFSRAWELGVGSFLGILAFHKEKTVFYSSWERYLPFVLALLISALAINEDNWAKLMPIPVIATGILLYTGQGQQSGHERKSKILKLGGRFTLYLGKISYSLYLVHWPIYIIASHFELVTELFAKLALVPLSIGCAHILWRFVEIPFQKITLPKKSKVDRSIFNFLKVRKMWVASLTFCLVGSLYVVTYPSVSQRLIYSESNMVGVADDPALQLYANYQDKIVNQGGLVSGLDLNPSKVESRTALETNLPQLLSAHSVLLRSGLQQNRLTEKGISSFSNLSQDISVFEQSICQKQDTEVAPDCSTRSTGATQKKVALIGDSKMGQFAQPLIEYFDSKGWQVFPYLMYGCNFLAPDNSIRTNCVKRTEWVHAQLKLNRFDLVIGAVYPMTSQNSQTANSNLDKLINLAKKVVWISQFPRVPNPKDCIRRDFTYPASCFRVLENEQKSFLAFQSLLANKANDKLTVVDSTLWTCINLDCPIVAGDIFINRDGSHLTNTFVKSINPIITATMESFSGW